jgi:diaminohydroxyphosphoribosylaminopyrimidine deaminase/5-amino-6-(5-phosphoribosylamino)uracil reductase
MHRCLQLAKLAQGYVAPNPMVGAVLVYQDKIIGEGYHEKFGGPHAEVNCINSVKQENQHLISQSTLYVSLEPCAHYGKTPPCTDLILEKKVPKVVIGCRDPFVHVNGKGIERLQSAGVDISVGVLEEECKELNRRFFTFQIEHRPYIVLKWGQTLDNKIGSGSTDRLLISNHYTNRIVHKWRSEEAAILIGTNTALFDDPELTTRLWPGKNPIRLVVDMDLRLPQSLKLFNGSSPIIVFNLKMHSDDSHWKNFSSSHIGKSAGVLYYQVSEDVSLVHQICNALYQLKIQSVLVEGGAQLLQSFIDVNMWDEARVITNERMIVGEGLSAPVLKCHRVETVEYFNGDVVRYFLKLL